MAVWRLMMTVPHRVLLFIALFYKKKRIGMMDSIFFSSQKQSKYFKTAARRKQLQEKLVILKVSAMLLC